MNSWNLTDLESVVKNNKTVFSCFHCGGGSTMGYKLSGFTVLGGVEIDPRMMKIYRTNFKIEDRFSFLMPIQDFKNISNENLPSDLFNLDILDGSPPCSSFSMSGSREDAWGKEKKFAEGQSKQVLDDLFFHFIDVAAKLKPKIVVAENVKGLVIGKAKGYVNEIFKKFDAIGYDTQLFLLNAQHMNVPQARERVFFIARRKDLNLKKLELDFHEPVITVSKAFEGLPIDNEINLTKKAFEYWKKTIPGNSFGSTKWFNHARLHPQKPSPTTMSRNYIYHWNIPRKINKQELIRIQTFPDDYFCTPNQHNFTIGMSVPPKMMQALSNEIYKQLLQ